MELGKDIVQTVLNVRPSSRKPFLVYVYNKYVSLFIIIFIMYPSYSLFYMNLCIAQEFSFQFSMGHSSFFFLHTLLYKLISIRDIYSSIL
jgi:hypothetical protein